MCPTFCCLVSTLPISQQGKKNISNFKCLMNNINNFFYNLFIFLFYCRPPDADSSFSDYYYYLSIFNFSYLFLPEPLDMMGLEWAGFWGREGTQVGVFLGWQMGWCTGMACGGRLKNRGGGTFLEEEDVHRGARDRERGRTWGEITGQREEGTHRGVALEGANTGTCFYKLSVLSCTYHFVKFFWISKGAVLKVN